MPDENTVVAPTPNPSPETFSREYVSELRNENKGYRLKAQELEIKAKEAIEAATRAATEADEKVVANTQSANDRILRAELKAAAIKAGMVDLDGLKLADLSKVKLGEDGEVEGADALMASMKESKPYLFGANSTTSQTTPAPNKKPDEPIDARKLSKDEYEAKKKELTARK